MSEADSPQAISPEKKRRSWRVRWSLRFIIGATAASACALAVVTSWMRQGHLHEAVAADLQLLGADIGWKLVEIRPIQGHNDQTIYFLSAKIKKGPDWMQAIGAEPIFQRIDQVALTPRMSPRAVDAALTHVGRLGRVKIIGIYNVRITQSQLNAVLSQVEIETLYTDAAELDSGRIPCFRHSKLRELTVKASGFSNAAIDDLSLSLEFFDGTETQINDAGLQRFVRLKHLTHLNLGRTPTTQAAIEDLRQKMSWCEIRWEPLLPEDFDAKAKAPSR